MRYDTPVFFQCIRPGEYDPSTGNYGADAVTEEKCYASVVDAGADTVRLIYGKLRHGSLSVCLQTHYTKTFDRIRIGRKTYRVDFERRLRVKHYFVVSEAE